MFTFFVFVLVVSGLPRGFRFYLRSVYCRRLPSVSRTHSLCKKESSLSHGLTSRSSKRVEDKQRVYTYSTTFQVDITLNDNQFQKSVQDARKNRLWCWLVNVDVSQELFIKVSSRNSVTSSGVHVRRVETFSPNKKDRVVVDRLCYICVLYFKYCTSFLK